MSSLQSRGHGRRGLGGRSSLGGKVVEEAQQLGYLGVFRKENIPHRIECHDLGRVEEQLRTKVGLATAIGYRVGHEVPHVLLNHFADGVQNLLDIGTGYDRFRNCKKKKRANFSKSFFSKGRSKVLTRGHMGNHWERLVVQTLLG